MFVVVVCTPVVMFIIYKFIDIPTTVYTHIDMNVFDNTSEAIVNNYTVISHSVTIASSLLCSLLSRFLLRANGSTVHIHDAK